MTKNIRLFKQNTYTGQSSLASVQPHVSFVSKYLFQGSYMYV